MWVKYISVPSLTLSLKSSQSHVTSLCEQTQTSILRTRHVSSLPEQTEVRISQCLKLVWANLSQVLLKVWCYLETIKVKLQVCSLKQNPVSILRTSQSLKSIWEGSRLALKSKSNLLMKQDNRYWLSAVKINRILEKTGTLRSVQEGSRRFESSLTLSLGSLEQVDIQVRQIREISPQYLGWSFARQQVTSLSCGSRWSLGRFQASHIQICRFKLKQGLTSPEQVSVSCSNLTLKLKFFSRRGQFLCVSKPFWSQVTSLD